MEGRTAIWPFDILDEPRPAEREDPNHLRCFLISPFTPKNLFDDLKSLVQRVCDEVGKTLMCRVQCIRADDIVSSGVIHSEIWHEIQAADVVVADVSGLNGNVMIELGVASACRKKEHVIILKEDKPNEHFLFDIGPARHILYNRTFGGFEELFGNLFKAILMSLTAAPFKVEPKIAAKLPLKVDFTKGKDVDWLICPSLTHRRLNGDYLEFGSLFVFRNSWLSVAGHDVSKFELAAEMKFTKLRDRKGWIGISIRNQHFFANYGHLLYLTSEGEVCRTVPQDEFGRKQKPDPITNSFSKFDPAAQHFYKFRIRVNDHIMSMFIENMSGKKIGGNYKIAEMPYVYNSGRILFQTFNAWAGIRTIEIQ